VLATQYYSKWARKGSKKIYHHVSRPHQKRDLKIFSFLSPGETSAGLSPSKQKWIIYSMKSFKDRYRRQALLEPSTTIMAHISKDGLYYVHPTQLRSLTPREAARLQSFPDSFIFSKYRTATYKQIGNAVPPLLAKAIGNALKCFF
jgi:DNA (cytosine-5)-methyltransferase 1